MLLSGLCVRTVPATEVARGLKAHLECHVRDGYRGGREQHLRPLHPAGNEGLIGLRGTRPLWRGGKWVTGRDMMV